MGLEGINIVYGRTFEEWYEKYGNTSLWSFSVDDVRNGSVKLDEDMYYWLIDDRLYETMGTKEDKRSQPRKKVPAKRPPMKKVSNTIPVNDPEMLEEIWKAELASAKNILRDNGYVTLTKEEYQTLKQAAEVKDCENEERLYVIYKGEFSGYIARVCNDNPSVTSLVKVQSQLAEDGYWVSKVCSSPTDNEIFMICYKEGD